VPSRLLKIASVLISGGSTQIPLVREKLAQLAERREAVMVAVPATVFTTDASP
jgi:molecular chaperone DnaK (HSP70)